MKKPVKITLWALGGVFLLVILLVLALPLWIGPVVTGVANGIVPGYTGTDFKMESFSFNPYSGKLRIGAITLANPKGYDEASAFSVRSISMDFDTCSFFTKKIHFADISIEEPFVSYVYDAAGTNNFDRILASAKAKAGSAEEKSKETEEEVKETEPTKLLIDRLAINGISVKYRMVKIPIPFPTLTDIGKRSDGATPEEVALAIWDAIKKNFTNLGGALGNAAGLLGTGATNTVKDASKLLGNAAEGATGSVKAATEGATSAVKGVTEGATSAMKGATDGAKNAVKDAGKVVGDGVKAVGDGAKAVGEGAKDALKKVGNLFGR